MFLGTPAELLQIALGVGAQPWPSSPTLPTSGPPDSQSSGPLPPVSAIGGACVEAASLPSSPRSVAGLDVMEWYDPQCQFDQQPARGRRRLRCKPVHRPRSSAPPRDHCREFSSAGSQTDMLAETLQVQQQDAELQHLRKEQTAMKHIVQELHGQLTVLATKL